MSFFESDSVSIRSLPRSSDELRRELPFGVDLHGGVMSYSGLPKLSLKFEVTPPESLPRNADGRTVDWTVFKESLMPVCLGIENFSDEEFCDALGLECNHYVSWVLAWEDWGKWEVFGIGGGGFRSTRDEGPSPIVLTPHNLRRAIDLFARRRSPTNPGNGGESESAD